MRQLLYVVGRAAHLGNHRHRRPSRATVEATIYSRAVSARSSWTRFEEMKTLRPNGLAAAVFPVVRRSCRRKTRPPLKSSQSTPPLSIALQRAAGTLGVVGAPPNELASSYWEPAQTAIGGGHAEGQPGKFGVWRVLRSVHSFAGPFRRRPGSAPRR